MLGVPAGCAVSCEWVTCWNMGRKMTHKKHRKKEKNNRNEMRGGGYGGGVAAAAVGAVEGLLRAV